MHHRPRHRRHLIETLEPRQLLSTVTVANATASESAGSLTFHVSLDAPATHDVTLRYVTAPSAHAATPNKDYVPARGQLTLPAGQTEADITVTLKDDSLYEPTETLRLNLRLAPFSAGPTGRASADHLATPSATGTITDDDLAPTVTVDDVTTKESNAGHHTVTLTVSLSKPAGSPLTFKYASSDDTPHFLAATAGSDYAAAQGTLTFRPGQTQKTIRVAVKGDRAAESDESFRVTLSYQGNDVAAAAVTIKNDDKAAKTDAPILSISDATALEGDSGTSQAAVTVTLSKPTDHDVTFYYNALPPVTRSRTADGMLVITPQLVTAGSLDYVPAQGKITIPAGQTSATIPVTLLGDTNYEPNQTFEVNVSGVKNARPINGRSDVSAAFHVIDDEPVLYADADGNVVAAPSGLSRASDQLLTYYNTGIATVPVLYSQSRLIAPASAATNISIAARFPDYAVTAVGSNAYVLNTAAVATAGTLAVSGTSLAVTNLTLSSSTASAGTLRINNTGYTGAAMLLGGTTTISAVSLDGAGSLTKSGTGAIILSGTNTYTGATSVTGSTLAINSGFYGDANLNGRVNADDYALLDRGRVTGVATLTSNGTLLLSPGTSFTFSATTPPDTIRARLLSAFSAGAWTGPGISSPAASNDPDHRTAVAYAVQPDGSTLVKPALYGDANLDGTVDAADRALIQQSLSDPATSPSWSAGDFNYDNQINADDLTLLDRNLGRSL